MLKIIRKILDSPEGPAPKRPSTLATRTEIEERKAQRLKTEAERNQFTAQQYRSLGMPSEAEELEAEAQRIRREVAKLEREKKRKQAQLGRMVAEAQLYKKGL